jgi:hypothetical protein
MNRQHKKCTPRLQSDETIGHIISAYPILAKEQYMKRYYKACVQLYLNICPEMGIKLEKEHWEKHVPKLVEIVHGGRQTYYGINN